MDREGAGQEPYPGEDVHARAADALDQAAEAHHRRATLWECSGNVERADRERQRAQDVAVMAARERALAKRATAAAKTAERPPEG